MLRADAKAQRQNYSQSQTDIFDFVPVRRMPFGRLVICLHNKH